MQIENLDSLKVWLTAYLEHVSDADPAALSKYVIALIKKDKPEQDLRTSMEEQMQVFLQSETKGFIAALFVALESKDYLQGPPTFLVKADDDASPSAAGTDLAAAENVEEEKVPDSTTPVRDPSATVGVDPPSGDRNNRSGGEGRYRRSESDRYEGGSGARRRMGSPRRRGRYRSRSRSPHHMRRSRSPPPYRRGVRHSPGTFRRSRSRSYSPPSHKRGNRESRGTTPIKDEESASNNPYLAASAPAVKRPRCRDYDEKGFCMRGDQCKFDHGTDAVVLDEGGAGGPPGAVPGVVPYTPAAVYAPGAVSDPYVPSTGSVAAPASVPLPPLHLPPPGYALPPTAIEGGHTNPRKRPFEDSHNKHNSPFNRLGGYRGRGRGRGRGSYHAGGAGSGGPTQIAVRNIPTHLNNIAHLNNHFARFGTLVNVQVQFEGDPASALVTFSSNREAEASINSADAVLGNRFIKMFYHYDKSGGGGLTSGCFKTGGAQRTPVKDRLGPAAGTPGSVQKSPGEDKVQFEGHSLTKTIANPSPKTEDEKRDFLAKKLEEKELAIAAIKKNQEMLEAKNQLKKEAEEKRQAQLKKVSEIQKQKSELLGKLIDEQKKLILIMDEKKGTLKPEERSEMIGMLKSLSTKIDKTKEDIKAAMQVTAVKKGPADLQRELLDAELELFQAEQDGSTDTTEIRAKCNALRVEAARTGNLPTSRGAHRGRGGYHARGGSRGGGYYASRPFRARGGHLRGRGGRGMYSAGTTTVDRRPSRILVSGYDAEDKDEVVAHFTKFGEILDQIEDESAPSLIFHYKSRREAELGMQGGKSFAKADLTLAWYTASTASDYHPSLDHSSVSVGSGGTGVTDHDEEEEEEILDDYEPLDPTYLPPGLEEETSGDGGGDKQEGGEEEEEGESGEAPAKKTKLDGGEANADDALLFDNDEEEEEEEGERSWKR